ncbi:hypothetical protein QBC42DRAFT_960 [Cladorrhinum samala]|uniref:RING-type domain-containing protein n=1 Tax=Cladorrhinum samala TaxID=585594 RepID=A0AAV9I1P8_9PEZI|nr:hypothetical protein QBC42DRAFT_960 [Cladorrhinum samala]
MKNRKSQVSYTIREKTGILEPERKTVEPETDPACPICQEPVGQKTPEGNTETWSELPCGHRFGSTCIKQYLGIVAEERPQCPICRQKAYHACDHPVLPVVLKDNGLSKQLSRWDNNKKRGLPAQAVEQMQNTLCGYCQQTHTTYKSRVGIRRLGMWSRCLLFLSPRARRTRRMNSSIQVLHGRNNSQSPDTVQWPIAGYDRFRESGWADWWAKQLPTTEV